MCICVVIIQLFRLPYVNKRKRIVLISFLLHVQRTDLR